MKLLAKSLLRFALTGGGVFCLDFFGLWLLQHFLPPLLAVSLAYLTAVSAHFLLSRHWVFECGEAGLSRQLLRYALCVSLCWLCTVSCFSLCLPWLSGNIYLAKALTIPPTTLLGFFLMRRLVFHSPAHTPRPAPES